MWSSAFKRALLPLKSRNTARFKGEQDRALVSPGEYLKALSPRVPVAGTQLSVRDSRWSSTSRKRGGK